MHMEIYKKVIDNDSGSTAVEYGILSALLAVAVIGCMALLSEPVGGLFGGVAEYFLNIDVVPPQH